MKRSWVLGGLVLAALIAALLPAVITLVRSGNAWVAGLAATGFIPVALLLQSQRRLRIRVADSEAGLTAQTRQNAIADRLAGVGRVSLAYPGPRIRWSEEFCLLAGLDPATPPSPAVLARLLPQGLSQLETTLDHHARDCEPFVAEFEYNHPDRGSRLFRAQAHNSLSADGMREQIFLIVRDVTDDYRRITDAEADRDAAVAEAAQARRLASTDPLTGLANRRAAMCELDRALVAARAAGSNLALLMFDVDRFKRVNDEHGHLVGDRVLKRIAELARRLAGSADCLARVGGEEFFWLVPGADSQAAREAAERLRWTIEAGTALAPVPGVTVSVGWATLEASDTSLSLFGRADDALMEAKRDGRNTVRAAA